MGDASPMDYGDYLHLDEVLTAQHPLSPHHDELLFIVQHQTTELWLKLVLHELDAAISAVADDRLPAAFKMTARVSRIMEQLVHAWDVLATMTPPEYSAIRPYLGESSGFQSWQYRCLEFRLGNKKSAMLRPHEHSPERLPPVEAAFRAPSLYDEALRLLPRRGLPVPADHVERDVTQPHGSGRGCGGGLGHDLRGGGGALRSLRIGRGAGRPGGCLPDLAFPPHEDGGAHH